MARTMTIGQLAKAAGVNVETVRYYQRRGLIPEPVRPPAGQRHYAEGAVRRMGFIRGAQRLGFSLEEVKSLLELSGGETCRKARQLAEEKHEMLGVRVAELNSMRRQLRALIKQCLAAGRGSSCPLIDALYAESAKRR